MESTDVAGVPRPFPLDKRHLDKVHARRGRPAIESRTIVISDPPEIAEDQLTRSAWRKAKPVVTMDDWLRDGHDHALAMLGAELAGTAMRSSRNRKTVREQARRFRERAAAADEATYQAAVDAVREWSAGHGGRQFMAAYLVPTEPDLAVSLGDADGLIDHELALLSCSKVSDLRLVDRRFTGFTVGTLSTLVDAFGSDVRPYLYRWLTEHIGSAPIEKEFVDIAMGAATEPAWRGVVSGVHVGYQVAACRRDAFKKGFKQSPELAARVFLPRLAEEDRFAEKHRYLGDQLIADHPQIIDAELDGYDSLTTAFVDEVRSGLTSSAAVAIDADVPSLLLSPPWENREKVARRLTVRDVETLAVEPTMRWLDGEREQWGRKPRNKPPADHAPTIADWETVEPIDQITILMNGDVEELRPYAARLELPLRGYHKHLVARFELDLLTPILAMAFQEKAAWERPLYGLLVPYGVLELAELFVEVYGRGTKAQKHAIAWMERHPELASTHLIPRVVSTSRKGRSTAEAALRVVARTDEPVVREVAAQYGPEVEAAVSQFLEMDPLDILPTHIPKLPDYLRASSVRAPVLRATGTSLPGSAVENIIIMLALSQETQYAGIDQVRQWCEPESLAAFSLDLYEAWNAAGRIAKDKWLAAGIDFLGDDSILDETSASKPSALTARARIDIFERIGSDAALEALFHLSLGTKHKPTLRDARVKIKALAKARGLSPDELADRLIPTFDLDLDRDGSRTFDFGSRSFAVTFDETLTPVISDGEGKVRKSLPKAAAADDAVLAAVAQAEFKSLKKGVRETARAQLKRFEAAMVQGRRWPRSEFERCFVNHPLMSHLARRLVWGVFEDASAGATAESGGDLIASFRIAEDGSHADSGDNQFDLAADAVVGVAHPVELEDLSAWIEVFSDYEIGQPFEQLGRAVFRIDDVPEMVVVNESVSINGDPLVPYQRILGLISRGWENQQIGSSTGYYSRQLRDSTARLRVSPGFAPGREYEDQHVSPITLRSTAHPVDVSEILRVFVWLSRPR